MVEREGVPSGKVAVIYNGLESSVAKKPFADSNVRNELAFSDKVPLVGMVANFNFEIKGHRYFLQAAKEVSHKTPDTNFLLIGEGPLRPQYEEMARELEVGKKVHFLGKRTDVPAILSQLDISVLSSTSEGFSNVLLESMAVGIPVVATRVGGNPEIVIDGVTGYLIPPADPRAMAEAILHLLDMPNEATEMGAAGRTRVEENFSVESMVRSYERLYTSLAKAEI
jgi:glycosyltransferase involved in cell wall biosynthesis